VHWMQPCRRCEQACGAASKSLPARGTAWRLGVWTPQGYFRVHFLSQGATRGLDCEVGENRG
jgi:hypothetical protein